MFHFIMFIINHIDEMSFNLSFLSEQQEVSDNVKCISSIKLFSHLKVSRWSRDVNKRSLLFCYFLKSWIEKLAKCSLHFLFEIYFLFRGSNHSPRSFIPNAFSWEIWRDTRIDTFLNLDLSLNFFKWLSKMSFIEKNENVFYSFYLQLEIF